jgi:hypothetical protein
VIYPMTPLAPADFPPGAIPSFFAAGCRRKYS